MTAGFRTNNKFQPAGRLLLKNLEPLCAKNIVGYDEA